MSARLFVAVEVSEEDRRALTGWAREAVGEDAGMRLVPPDNVHLTLAFLGHRALDEIEPLSDVVERFEGVRAPVLRTGGALWLAPRRPHVLTVAIEDLGGRLAELHDAVWSALEVLGFEREQRRFRPHLTVARVRHGWMAPSHRLPELPERPLSATELVLFRSWLGGGPPDADPTRPRRGRGARYEPLVRAPLSGPS